MEDSFWIDPLPQDLEDVNISGAVMRMRENAPEVVRRRLFILQQAHDGRPESSQAPPCDPKPKPVDEQKRSGPALESIHLQSINEFRASLRARADRFKSMG